MSNTLYVPKNKNIDRRTKNIVHLSDGSIKYDFNKYNSYIEAIYADYIDCRTDEQLKESISLCFADSLDQKVIFKKLKLQFLSALANTDKALDMKNIYGKTVYPKYEIALKQHVKGSVEDNYESVEFDGADNYREAVKMAKKYALDIGSGNMRYKESASLDACLAQVTIICYYSDDISDYNEVWQEEYINGKKTKRY